MCALVYVRWILWGCYVQAKRGKLVPVSALLVLVHALLVLVSALLVLASALLVPVSPCKVTQIGKVGFPFHMQPLPETKTANWRKISLHFIKWVPPAKGPS